MSPRRRAWPSRHPVKLLNLGLALYLALGGLLFEWLAHWEREWADGQTGAGTRRPIAELRATSAARMWNITNKLNVLYESNWTELMLAELADFERQLVESLAEGQHQDERQDQAEERDKDHESDQRSAKSTGGNRRPAASARGSIKSSLIHSLATITTMGSPNGSHGQKFKLVTIIYAVGGLPLMLATILKTGQLMALKATNPLLILRHHLFALPMHYLGAALSWLFCCFRCLCCCGLGARRRQAAGSRPCDRPAPRLRLLSRGLRRKAPSGGLEATQVGPYVIGADRPEKPAGDQQKSVRFSGGNQIGEHKSTTGRQLDHGMLGTMHEQSCQLHSLQRKAPLECSPFTFGLFVASLATLGAYMTLGALLFSKTNQNFSFLDSLFICYELLSTSRLPSSFRSAGRLHPGPPSIKSIYKSLLATPIQPDLGNPAKEKESHRSGNQMELPANEDEQLIWQGLYLFVGLDLISMCGHFARLWLSGLAEDEQSETDEPDTSATAYDITVGGSLCNGLGGAPSSSAGQFMVPGPPEEADDQSSQQQQIQLGELFVLGSGQQPPAAPAAAADCLYQAQYPSQASQELSSFASDRSGQSLCQLHQAAGSGSTPNGAGTRLSSSSSLGASTAGAIYGAGPQGTILLGHRQVATRAPSQAPYVARRPPSAFQMQELDEGDDHEDNFRLAPQVEALLAGGASFCHVGPSSALGLLATRESDLTATPLETTPNSNTISSISSRTVRLPGVHYSRSGNHQQSVGFLLDEDRN